MRSQIAIGAVGAWLLLVTACGGSSVSDSATGGSAGSGASAGTGGSATGGSGAVGGGGAGGTAAGGSGGSTGGAAGMAGAGGEGGLCGPSAKACGEPGDCTLAESSCCICGVAELSDYVAVNTQYASDCSCKGPMCGCASALNPNLAATCDAGSCEGFDVRQVDALSSCQSDADCTLRIGLDCCEACSGSEWDLVAVRKDAGQKLAAMLCGKGSVGCPGCIPQYPASKVAVCTDNHCQVSGSPK